MEPDRPASPLDLAPTVGASAGADTSRPPAAPVDSRYAPGHVIAGKYRLVRLLGEGGMGAVWLANNATLDVAVAVKLVRREMATPEAAARLLLEARASARLEHPSIVRVFDFGETEHHDPFIVMEFLDGETLGQVLLRQGRIPAVNAVRTLLPVADALVLAHGQGIVHRDLKPDNVVLVGSSNGIVTPKLVDFGIAKLRDAGTTTGVTVAGTVLGSPDYMSPEQARGEVDVDARTDVWAFSVMLYETVSGVRPFEGVNYNALLTSIQRDQPQPLTDHAAGNAELWTVVSRGLAKDPENRWQSMHDLGVALAIWCLEQDVLTDIGEGSIEAHWLSETPERASAPMIAARLAQATGRRSSPSSRRRIDVVTLEGPAVLARLTDAPTSNTPIPKALESSSSRVPVRRRLLGGAVAGAVLLGVVLFALWQRTVTVSGVSGAALSASPPAVLTEPAASIAATPPAAVPPAAVAPSATASSAPSASPSASVSSRAVRPSGPRPTLRKAPDRRPRGVVPDDPNF
jgi:serine/threonine protein kinase